MDSKYNLINKNIQMQKFQIKRKPSPLRFENKNDNHSPKRLVNENHLPKGVTMSNNHNSLTSSYNNDFIKNRNKTSSIQEQRRKLPVFEKRNRLLELIRQHSTLIIVGETGSGKTTQIPQFINAARLQNNGRIAVTQPRRVAAISIAMRVAQEMGDPEVGENVGYTVRFEDVSSAKTKIKYLTDGMLLREAVADNLLLDYTVVILDEAHERTIHTDVLFGIVKQAQKIRGEKELKPLRIVIMSATMDVDHFSEYFNNCQAVYLEGRTHPVNVFYTLTPHEDYQAACVSTFFKINKEAPHNHDVLIFLTGQEEVEAVAYQIRVLSRDPDVEGPAIKVCPLYAAQPTPQQMAVFQPTPASMRKVIVSTNVAETSVTISGVRYVIDSGMVKSRSYHPATGLDMLVVQPISQEQSWQRTGRAGRESEGYCYRIYTRKQYDLMNKTTVPEIQRANLATVAIQLLALGIHALHFDFMDAPPKESIFAAFEQLKLLGAIEDVHSKNLTLLGRKMVQFPLDPRFSKILLSAQKYGCIDEMLTIVACLSGESIYLNPPTKRDQAINARQKFASPYGDHIMLLNTFKEFSRLTPNTGSRDFKNISGNYQRSWCLEHYINMRNIQYASQVRTQLSEICERLKIPISSCGDDIDQIRKCLLSGLFMNVAELHKDRQYITLDRRQAVIIHPSSVLYGQQPPSVLFTEVVQTSKCYLRGLTTIENKWLHEIAPDYIQSHNIRFIR